MYFILFLFKCVFVACRSALKRLSLLSHSWCCLSTWSTSSSVWCFSVRPSGSPSASTCPCSPTTSGGTWVVLWWAVRASMTPPPSWTLTSWPTVRKKAGANSHSTSSPSSTISTEWSTFWWAPKMDVAEGQTPACFSKRKPAARLL